MKQITKQMNIVSGDLLNDSNNLNFILQQLNCLCVKPHGLSKTISDKYPHGKIYEARQKEYRRNLAVEKDRDDPGSVIVSFPSPSNKLRPIIIGLFGQYDFGKSYYKNNRPILDPPESNQLREIWFQSCLNTFRNWLVDNNYDNDNTRIGLPYGIGCGLAGGNWNTYHPMIKNFEKEIKCQVILYKL